MQRADPARIRPSQARVEGLAEGPAGEPDTRSRTPNETLVLPTHEFLGIPTIKSHLTHNLHSKSCRKHNTITSVHFLTNPER